MSQIILNAQAQFQNFRAVVGETVNVLLLGSRGDSFYTPPDMMNSVKILGIDAAQPVGATNFTAIQTLLSEKGEPGTFILRKHGGVSGMLEADMEQVRAFGQEHWYEELSRTPTNSISLDALMKAHGIQRAHFLKTDLEGMDFPVVRSLGDRIRQSLLVKMECRFEAMNVGEHLFPEVAQYLYGKGFRLLDLTIADKWRYRTAHWTCPTRGRVNYGDAFFLYSEQRTAADALIQAYLLGASGYVNMAERVLETHRFVGAEDMARQELLNFLFAAMPAQPYIPIRDLPHSVGMTI